VQRLGHSRRSFERYERHGRPAQENADYRLYHADRLLGDCRGGYSISNRSFGLLLERRDFGTSLFVHAGESKLAARPGLLLRGTRRRGADGVLYVPPVVHDHCRRAAQYTSLRSCPRQPAHHVWAAAGDELFRHYGGVDALLVDAARWF